MINDINDTIGPFPDSDECMQTCPKLKRSRVPSILDAQKYENFRLLQQSWSFDPNGQHWGITVPVYAIWLPIKKDMESRWTDWYTGELIKDEVLAKLPWVTPDADCGIHAIPFAGATPMAASFPCLVEPFEPFQCMCSADHQFYLKLRGLCPSSNIDKFWVLRTIDGLIKYHGIVRETFQQFNKRMTMHFII